MKHKLLRPFRRAKKPGFADAFCMNRLEFRSPPIFARLPPKVMLNSAPVTKSDPVQRFNIKKSAPATKIDAATSSNNIKQGLERPAAFL